MSAPTAVKSTAPPTILQYLQAQQQYPNLLLLFRVGDRLHALGDDAELLGRLCCCVLTPTSAGTRTSIHSDDLERTLRVLLQAGHRVAICDPVKETS